MRLLVLVPPVLLALAPVLAGCSAPDAVSPAGSSSSTSGPPASGGASEPGASSTPADPGSGSGSGSGSITFDGALSGTMTLAICHDGAPAQLNVAIDGEDKTYAGLIDADDFTFVAPGTGYTLASEADKPTVSGRTYTVHRTKLVSISNDDTVTAEGSVTCP